MGLLSTVGEKLALKDEHGNTASWVYNEDVSRL